jgi:hypothetical protein
MKYTFYGDLLGISGYYKLDSKIAYRNLNEFYNTTFFSLSDYCNQNGNTVQVDMFSDSLLIRGDHALQMLEELHKVYINLLMKGLYLRGAMVKGRLEVDPRITLNNYQKMLPSNDTLARAVGLEKSQKGARLLIENTLAQDLLEDCNEWLTVEGYNRNSTNYPRVRINDLRRRIAPTPDSASYELLYFWNNSNSFSPHETDYNRICKQLKSASKMVSKETGYHYQETIELLERCKERQRFTEDV